MKPDLTQQTQQEKPARKTLKQWLLEYRLALIVAAVDLLMWIFAPAQAAPVMSNTWDYLIELMVIIIPVTVLMGLFEVWVPKQLIAKYLGHEFRLEGDSACAFVRRRTDWSTVYCFSHRRHAVEKRRQSPQCHHTSECLGSNENPATSGRSQFSWTVLYANAAGVDFARDDSDWLADPNWNQAQWWAGY